MSRFILCQSVLRRPPPSTLAGLKFSSLSTHRSQAQTSRRSNETIAVSQAENHDYHGPLGTTFRRLKMFSLSSLALAIGMAPVILVAESSLPLGARIALATTAVATSGVSTALVSWCGNPYVFSLRSIKSPENNRTEGLELTTLSLWLRKRITRVYDTSFLVPTKRPMAKWELAEIIQETEKGVTPGIEETVAETMDSSGKVLGRWIVKWGDDHRGTCRRVGNIVRHFNVHEELL